MTRSSHIVALIGTPNCGKTALFNVLTGGRQRVGNYPGVTVEKKSGTLATKAGNELTLIDLPGLYSLDAHSPDESIASSVLLGSYEDELRPEIILAVCDATNLERTLGLIVEVKKLGIPMVLALNMIDIATKRKLELKISAISQRLGVPVIATSATQKIGLQELTDTIDSLIKEKFPTQNFIPWHNPTIEELITRNNFVREMVEEATVKEPLPDIWSRRIDSIALHRFFGPLLLALILFSLFQAVFSWAETPMNLIENALGSLGTLIANNISNETIKSLLVDGIIGGVGGE